MIEYMGLCIVGGAVIGVVGIAVRNRIVFIRRGWTIIGVGRDSIAYVERGKGKITFSAELMGRGPINRVIVIPGSSWNSALPQWAHGRRDEILGRLQLVLPPSRNEYKMES